MQIGILLTIVKLKTLKRVFYMIKLHENKKLHKTQLLEKMKQLQRPCFADFWRVGLWDNPLLTHSLYPFPPYHPDNKYNIRSLRNQLLILLQLLLIPPPSFLFSAFFLLRFSSLTSKGVISIRADHSYSIWQNLAYFRLSTKRAWKNQIKALAYALVVNLNALFSHFIFASKLQGINESVWSLVRLMRTYYGSEQCISMVAGPHCANWAGIVNFHTGSRGGCPRSPLLPTGHQWFPNWVPFSCRCSHRECPPPSKPYTICRKVKAAGFAAIVGIMFLLTPVSYIS